MFSRCVFCNSSLPANRTLEQFPLGHRIAYDPAQGRLWVICAHCMRWNLAPIDERWEVLEVLERLRERGRLLAGTEHISLIQVADLDLVRVGRANLAEEAWWRYGTELRRRRSRYNKVVAADVGLAIVFFPFWGWGGVGADSTLNRYSRFRKFGSTAWRGFRSCSHCGNPLTELHFRHARDLILTPSGDDFVLEFRCAQCKLQNNEGGFTFEGIEAERLLRKSLAYYNYSGADENGVKAAVHVIDQAGSAGALVRSLSQQRFPLGEDSNRSHLALALEIAVNDDVEREQLELELAELEARWLEEEELAGIIDGELTETSLFDRLRLRLNRS